jgi:hypothetical protein
MNDPSSSGLGLGIYTTYFDFGPKVSRLRRSWSRQTSEVEGAMPEFWRIQLLGMLPALPFEALCHP